MVSTSGTQLLPETAVKIFCEHMLPFSTILTPNIPEARLLLEYATRHASLDLHNVTNMITLAKDIHQLGIEWVLLKGGHFPWNGQMEKPSAKDGKIVVLANILYSTHLGEQHFIKSDYVLSRNTHGTGCSLACQCYQVICQHDAKMYLAAIACNIALGHDIPKAVENTCKYVEVGIRTAIPRGRGNGPINHFQTLPSSDIT